MLQVAYKWRIFIMSKTDNRRNAKYVQVWFEAMHDAKIDRYEKSTCRLRIRTFAELSYAISMLISLLYLAIKSCL